MELDKLDLAFGSGMKGGLFTSFAGYTADMEGPHGQLGSRLPDGLGGGYPDRLSDIDLFAVSQVPSITLGTNPSDALAGQYGSDQDFLYTGFFNPFHRRLIDFAVGRNQYFFCKGIFDIFQRDPSQDALADRLNHLPGLPE